MGVARGDDSIIVSGGSTLALGPGVTVTHGEEDGCLEPEIACVSEKYPSVAG